MDETEKARILRELQAGRDALQTSTLGVDDELARRKPSAEKWSILECVEHMIGSERYLLTQGCTRPNSWKSRSRNRGARRR